MPDGIAEYVETVRSQIRWERAQPGLTAEVRTHLLDQKDACIATGMAESDAESEALRQMGDPVMVGVELDRVHRPTPQWGLLALTALLAVLGLMLHSMWMTQIWGPQFHTMERSIFAVCVGFALMTGIYLLDFSWLGAKPVLSYGVIVGAVAISRLISPQTMGVSYYTQYLLFFFPVAYALILYALRGRGTVGVLLAGAALAPLAVLITMTPSISSLLLMCLCGLLLLLGCISKGWFGGRKGIQLAIVLSAVVVVMIWAAVLISGEYGRTRLLMLVHPESDPYGYGYFPLMVRELLHGAKWIGTGSVGELFGALEYLSDNFVSDFLLTWVIHQFGWLPAILLLAVLTAFLGLGLRHCLRQKNALGRLLSTAVMLTLLYETVQYVINNLGFMLLGGLQLPLLSNGNLYTMVNLVLIGLALSVFRGEKLPLFERCEIPQACQNRKSLISWQDGNLIIALGRGTRR